MAMDKMINMVLMDTLYVCMRRESLYVPLARISILLGDRCEVLNCTEQFIVNMKKVFIETMQTPSYKICTDSIEAMAHALVAGTVDDVPYSFRLIDDANLESLLEHHRELVQDAEAALYLFDTLIATPSIPYYQTFIALCLMNKVLYDSGIGLVRLFTEDVSEFSQLIEDYVREKNPQKLNRYLLRKIIYSTE